MSSKQRYDITPYADIDLPIYREPTPPDAIHDTSAWSLIVVSANTLLAIVLIVGMVYDGKSVALSIISGAVYYALTTIAVIALSSGQAGILWRTLQQERTERHRINAYEYLAERKLELDAQPRLLPVDPVQPLHDDAPSYVSPYTSEAIAEALQWLYGLYDHNGQLDPRRVRSGYVQGSVIGSRRGDGSVEAKQVLIAARVIKPAEGGYKFAVRRYPTLAQVDALARRLQGGVSG